MIETVELLEFHEEHEPIIRDMAFDVIKAVYPYLSWRAKRRAGRNLTDSIEYIAFVEATYKAGKFTNEHTGTLFPAEEASLVRNEIYEVAKNVGVSTLRRLLGPQGIFNGLLKVPGYDHGLDYEEFVHTISAPDYADRFAEAFIMKERGEL